MVISNQQMTIAFGNCISSYIYTAHTVTHSRYNEVLILVRILPGSVKFLWCYPKVIKPTGTVKQ